jgi:hypothetical protein
VKARHPRGASVQRQDVQRVDIVQFAVVDVGERPDAPRRSSNVCSLMAALVERNETKSSRFQSRLPPALVFLPNPDLVKILKIRMNTN